MSTAIRLQRFITFEGGEGAGKSTQIELLARRLRAAGCVVHCTREPGGSPNAELVRRLVVEGAADRWLPDAEMFLFLAARADHLARVIRPRLEAGEWVLCDRYWDSTRVYQGICGFGEAAAIDALHRQWLEPFCPELTLLLDLPASLGLERAKGGRFEAKGLAFHERIREGFRTLAAGDSGRIVVVDAGRDREAVAADIWGIAKRRWPGHWGTHA